MSNTYYVNNIGQNYVKANIGAGSTDSNLVTAVSQSRVRVVALATIVGGTATTVTFLSKGTGSGQAVSMDFQNGANGGAVLPLNPAGWFETNLSEGLTVTTLSGSTTGVQIVYQVIA